MKKLLITGGCGFIGSEFIRQGVEKGYYKIVVVDCLTYAGDIERIRSIKDKVRFYKTDVTDKEGIDNIFSTEKPDIVVHFAAESHVDRSILDAMPFLDTNIKGTQILLDASRHYGIERFVNISTDEVYGELKDEGQFLETTPLNPNSPYSVSKASADMLGRAYFRTYGLPVITIRPSNNYGPWQYPEKFIPVVILKALNNEKIPIYGKGQNIREWLYVSDCVRGIFSAIEKGLAGEIYNIGSGEEKRNIEVVKIILNIIGKPEDLIEFVKDRPGHDYRYSMNSEKIKRELGWKPEITFQTGIEKTIKWYIENMEWVRTKLNYLKDYWERVYK